MTHIPKKYKCFIKKQVFIYTVIDTEIASNVDTLFSLILSPFCCQFYGPNEIPIKFLSILNIRILVFAICVLLSRENVYEYICTSVKCLFIFAFN